MGKMGTHKCPLWTSWQTSTGLLPSIPRMIAQLNLPTTPTNTQQQHLHTEPIPHHYSHQRFTALYSTHTTNNYQLHIGSPVTQPQPPTHNQPPHYICQQWNSANFDDENCTYSFHYTNSSTITIGVMFLLAIPHNSMSFPRMSIPFPQTSITCNGVEQPKHWLI